MLPPEPLIGPPVHPLGLLREWLHHVSAPSEALPNGLRLVERPVHRVLPLTLVDQIVATAAQEVLPWPVKESHPPVASRTWTDKPRPLSTEVAGRPGKVHGFLHVFPFSAWTAPVSVKQCDTLSRVRTISDVIAGVALLINTSTAPTEPSPRLQKPLPMEAEHVHTMT